MSHVLSVNQTVISPLIRHRIGRMKKYYFYIAECADDTLYSGQTNDLSKRLERHNSGKGAKYTAERKPIKLVYSEEFSTRGAAMQRETEVKKLSRKKKLELVRRTRRTA